MKPRVQLRNNSENTSNLCYPIPVLTSTTLIVYLIVWMYSIFFNKIDFVENVFVPDSPRIPIQSLAVDFVGIIFLLFPRFSKIKFIEKNLFKMIFLLSVVHLLINAREIMIFSTLPSHNEVTVTSMVQESSRLENSINGTKFNLESKIKILNFHILNLEEKEEDLNYYLIEKLKNLEFKEKFQIESNLNCITQQKSTSDRNFVAVGSCFHQIKKRIKENESFKLELNFITRLIQILLIMLYKLRHLQNVDERRCSRRYDLISQDINDGNLDLDGNIYLIIQFKMIIFQFGLKNFFFRFKIPKVLKINVFYINPNSDINASALEEEPLPLYTPRYTPST